MAPSSSGQPFMHVDSTVTFPCFLKSNPTEVVLKSYKCNITCKTFNAKGKVYFTTNFICFVRKQDGKVVVLMPFIHVISITIPNSIILIKSPRESLTFALMNLQRNDYVANFLQNYWYLLVKPRLELMAKYNSDDSRRFSHASLQSLSLSDREVSGLRNRDDVRKMTASNSNESTSSPSLSISKLLSPKKLQQAALPTVSVSPAPTKEPKDDSPEVVIESESRNNAVMITTGFLEPFTSFFQRIIRFLRDCIAMAGFLSDRSNSPSNSFDNNNAHNPQANQRQVSLTMLIAYIIIILLAISTFYVYRRMCRFSSYLIYASRQAPASCLVRGDCASVSAERSLNSLKGQASLEEGSFHNNIDKLLTSLQELQRRL